MTFADVAGEEEAKESLQEVVEFLHDPGKYTQIGAKLVFFPVVGAVIAALVICLNGVPPFARIPVAVRIMLTLLIPLAITGGIHIDGYMDTEDALRSYSLADRKLEIMKDPRTGAFAVIALARYILIYAAAVTAILLNPDTGMSTVIILGLSFVISRCLSALTSYRFTKARSSGMLYELTKKKKRSGIICLIAELVAAVMIALCLNVVCAILVAAGAGLCTAYYRYMAYREFGGVTGDTAGWFLTVCETVSAVLIAISGYITTLWR